MYLDTFQDHFMWRRFGLQCVADSVAALRRLPSVPEFARVGVGLRNAGWSLDKNWEG